MTARTTEPAESRWAVPLILSAMLGFALQDLAVKLVTDASTIWQMQALRSLLVLAMMLVLAAALRRRHELLPGRWRWPLIRSGLMVVSYLLYYASMPFLTLAQAAAGFYVGPLFITLFAALLLGEPIGPRRILAVVLGFAGVLLIVRPGSADWEPMALLPVGAAIAYALAVVMTRWRCAGIPSLALTFTHNLAYAVLGVLGAILMDLAPVAEPARAAWPFLLTGWVPLTLVAFGLIAVTAVTHMFAMIASVAAYRSAEASRIAPFEYSYLAIMPGFDLLFWGVLPAPATLAGILLIIGSGGFVAWREGRPARPRPVLQGSAGPNPGPEAEPRVPVAAAREP